jgi:glycosyltransferase involved in cell wall biosynthesis
MRVDCHQKVKYFPNWAESIFSDESPLFAKEIQIIPGSFNVMFAGNIGESQDFPAILSAAEILKPCKNIRWHIVGDGRLGDWLRQEVEKRQLNSCVQLLGRHEVERMPSFYKHADAMLVSLKDEPIFSMTIPGKLQSYLAAGVPVLGMLNGEGAELIGTSRAGLICAAGDHAGLAMAVLKLSKMNREDRDSMGRNGLAVSMLEFDRRTLINKLEMWLINLRNLDHQKQSQ